MLNSPTHTLIDAQKHQILPQKKLRQPLESFLPRIVYRIWLCAFFVGLLISSLQGKNDQPDEPLLPAAEDDGSIIAFQGGRASASSLLLRLKNPNNPKQRALLEEKCRTLGLRINPSFHPASLPGCLCVDTGAGGGRAAAAPVQLTALQLAEAIKVLSETGLCLFVEPNWEVSIKSLPTDAAFADGTLWGLRNTGQNDGVAGIDVNVVPAWETNDGAGVVVAVIDSGVSLQHEDLAPNLWRNFDEIAGNNLDDDGNGFIDDVHGINAVDMSNLNGNPNDDHSHGTHVAGTIAAVANNAGRHVGVAPGAQIMPLKFLRANGGGTTAGALVCIDYAIKEGADIINASWGGGGFSAAMEQALTAAAEAGVMFVAAAGNASHDADTIRYYPMGYEVHNVIAVGALTRQGKLAAFSNYGATTVDLAAPGLHIYSTLPGRNYGEFSGTSMAAPHVSGVAALILAAHPTASLVELRNRLLQSTTSLSSLDELTLTGGMVNASGAIDLAPDGQFDTRDFINPVDGAFLIRGEESLFQVTVSDVSPILNATVTVTFAGENPITLLDDGSGADTAAGDGIYATNILIPTNAPDTLLATYDLAAEGLVNLSTTYHYNIVSRPDNDDLANRHILPFNVDGSTDVGTNKYASSEEEEPIDQVYMPRDHSVWWEWTPLVEGTAIIDTFGSDFNTGLAAYRGNPTNGFSSFDRLAINSNDRVSSQSRITFQIQSGTTYYLQVNSGQLGYADGDDAWLRQGNIQLSAKVVNAPPNDNFEDRIRLQPGTTSVIGSNRFGSWEENERIDDSLFRADILFTQGQRSVWWEWVPAVTQRGKIYVSNSEISPLLTVYEHEPFTPEVQGVVSEWSRGVTELGAISDDIILERSSLETTFYAGYRYYIRVDGSKGDEGEFTLNYPEVADVPIIDSQPLVHVFVNEGESANLAVGISGNGPFRYNWAVDGLIKPEYDSSSSINLDPARPEDAGHYTLTVSNQVGTSALVSFWVHVESLGVAPVNDDLADAILLENNQGIVGVSNRQATAEEDGPGSASSAPHSVWYRWEAPATGFFELDTRKSSTGTKLALYTREDGPESPLVLYRDNFHTRDGTDQAILGAAVIAGQIYEIEVSGIENQTGGIRLRYHFQPSVIELVDDFDPGIDESMWSAFNGTVEANTDGQAGGAGSTGNSLTVSGRFPRSVITAPVDCHLGGTIRFRYAQWDSRWLGNLFLLYSLDGYHFVEIEALPVSGTWRDYEITIPAQAYSHATFFRIDGLPFEGPENYYRWSLEDVQVTTGEADLVVSDEEGTPYIPLGGEYGAAYVVIPNIANATRTLTLENIDTSAPLSKLEVKLTGDGANAYQLSATPTEIEAGGRIEIDITSQGNAASNNYAALVVSSRTRSHRIILLSREPLPNGITIEPSSSGRYTVIKMPDALEGWGYSIYKSADLKTWIDTGSIIHNGGSYTNYFQPNPHEFYRVTFDGTK